MEDTKVNLTLEEKLAVGNDLLTYMNRMLEYQEKYLFLLNCLLKVTRSYPNVVKECLSDIDIKRLREGV